MKIKHSKYRNTGLIFELLVKQLAADTLNRKDSAAISIIKKHYTGKTAIVNEFKLYNFILKNRQISQSKAETILSTITEISRKIDRAALKKQKYNLISDIKENYNIEDFFAIQTPDYKALASLYCLLESQNSNEMVDPEHLINFKSTLLEHLTTNKQDKESVKDSLIEEYSKYDKDLKLLTFKFFLEKFNDTYKDLLPEQKNILREFITSGNSQTRLRSLVNEELEKIILEIKKLSSKVKNQVVKIKLDEVAKIVKPIEKKERIKDSHLVNLMQYYDLVSELKNL
jgi:hypothetical protein